MPPDLFRGYVVAGLHADQSRFPPRAPFGAAPVGGRLRYGAGSAPVRNSATRDSYRSGSTFQLAMWLAPSTRW